jgi:hypothetical protein
MDWVTGWVGEAGLFVGVMGVNIPGKPGLGSHRRSLRPGDVEDVPRIPMVHDGTLCVSGPEAREAAVGSSHRNYRRLLGANETRQPPGSGRMSKPLSKVGGSSVLAGQISSGVGVVRSSRRLGVGGIGITGGVVFGVMVRMADRRGSPRGTSAPQVTQTRPPRLTPSQTRHRQTALMRGAGGQACPAAFRPTGWRVSRRASRPPGGRWRRCAGRGRVAHQTGPARSPGLA